MTLTPTRASAPLPFETDREWWRTAVVYQVYVRSFADGDGDGIGDLAGVRARLPYLASLGIDAIWFTPWYASPLVDGGYDVEDYRRIHPDFGDLAEAEALISEAAALGIRTIVDVVPNHVSDRHAWFQEALAGAPGSAARARFWFRDGRGADGGQPPTTWPSSFSGTTWTRVTEADGRPGQWYLHLFTPEQPDLNWTDPSVAAEHESVLRFWFDRGVSGVRIDSAALVAKDPALPEIGEHHAPGTHPNLDRDELHDLYRSWRRIADEYADENGDRILVGEVWLADQDRFGLYLRPDEMHTAFNFDFMTRPWSAAALRESITSTMQVHSRIGAPPTWVLSNHDVTRPVTRLGRVDSGFSFDAKRFGIESDLTTGAARARAIAMLIAALPGVLYIYQGDELGLPEVEDLPAEALRDPMHYRSGGVDPGRDGCRVPLPWTRDPATAGFSPLDSTAAPWLPQPADWSERSVEAQEQDPDSTLTLYRRTLALRRRLHLGDGEITWLESSPDVLAFRHGELVCMTNLGEHALRLPADTHVLLTSGTTDHQTLPPDTTVWLT